MSVETVGSTMALTAHEMAVCKRVGDTLHKHYPGHMWGVNMVQGVIQVMNFALSGQWGFQIKEESLDPEDKIIIRSGGELLERFNVARAEMDPDEMNNKTRNGRGEVIEFDKS